MSGYPRYVDVSGNNAKYGPIVWANYLPYARQWDGKARIACKLTEGVGFLDEKGQQYIKGAQDHGAESIIYYHYSRPDLNKNPALESAWFLENLPTLRDSDYVMLDYEGFPGVSDAPWTPAWAGTWLAQVAQHVPADHVGMYSYDWFIRTNLQDQGLSRYPLYYARWTYNPLPLPPAPPNWKRYLAWQYSDKEIIPGVPGPVDANVWVGLPTQPGPDIQPVKTALDQAASAVAEAQAYILKEWG